LAAQYALMSQWNVLENVRTQHLEKFRIDRDRFMKLSLYYAPGPPNFVPFQDLTFIANTEYPNILQEIHLAEQSYHTCVETLAIKNKRLEDFYKNPNVSNKSFDFETGKGVVQASAQDIFFIRRVTDALYESIDKALPKLKTTILRLEIFIKLIFPGWQALQMVHEDHRVTEQKEKNAKG